MSRATSSDRLSSALSLLEQKKPLEARAALSTLLTDTVRQLSGADAEHARQTLATINRDLVFSSRIVAGDPLAETYTVVSGDVLSRIAPRYKIPYQLIEQINNVEATRIRIGQKLKVIKGPFHAVVVKSAFRMDIYLDAPVPDVAVANSAPPSSRIYIRSFTVGLGESDSTPVGSFIVTPGGKVANPGWTSPRTNKYFAPDDLANPIGEFWIGLEGADDTTRGRTGYGIHGTIEPDSIGKQASLGCVRMAPDDIALVYKLLTERYSTVRIEP